MLPNSTLKGLKIAGAVLGAFLALFLGMFLIFGGPPAGGSGGNGFLASLSSSMGNFLSREELVVELDLSARGGASFRPCAYGSLEAPRRGPVVLNEIAWMGTKEDYNAEWMELKNVSGREADISFWQIINADERVKITIPKDVKLPAGGFYLLARKIAGGISGGLPYDGALVNTGTGLRLFTADCGLADGIPSGKWPAGNNSTKQTMERTASLGWQTSSAVGGTPGAENSSGAKEVVPPKNPKNGSRSSEGSGTSSYYQLKSETVLFYPPILINEVFVGDEGFSADEYVEIWNPGDEHAPLTGWSIKKRSGTGSISSLVSASRLEGKVVPPHAYFLVANEGGNFAPAADVVWARSNTLAYSNNSVMLVNPKGEIIQEVSWVEIPKGSAFSRAESGNFEISGKSPKQPNF